MQGQLKIIQGWTCFSDEKAKPEERWTAKCFFNKKEHVLHAGSEVTLKQKIEKYMNSMSEAAHIRKTAAASSRALA